MLVWGKADLVCVQYNVKYFDNLDSKRLILMALPEEEQGPMLDHLQETSQSTPMGTRERVSVKIECQGCLKHHIPHTGTAKIPLIV